MAKKTSDATTDEATAEHHANGQADASRINKSAVIREYLRTHRDAMPKETVAALKAKGVDISPNMVSMVKAKLRDERVRRRNEPAGRAVGDDQSPSPRGAGLDAALLLYKAAQGEQVSSNRLRQAFLQLVELLG